MPAEATTRSVVVGAAASELRRALGPTSWMVLEELLMRSTGPAGACVSSASVRALATSLGLAKDTACRALRRLRDAGLVTVVQQRTVAGIFDTGTYVITVPDCIALHASTQTSKPPRARADSRHFSQLSLAIES